MKHTKFFNHRIASPDGKTIAQVQSMVSASGNEEGKISQSVMVKISGDGSSSSSSSSISGSVSVSSS
ncbi:hypothetical protein L2E69_01435 [Planktothrix agardhii 1806]|uniref:hypothetical protein n=1 Tax=Planktothrix agardhii TaxID=1160 RepID=UPI001D0AC8FF|nr:hypothetical protein [Planktothrix agardhii]MCB8767076.1 hypothetical protein [Planktothrix agardhii 1809]MCB8776194.1 hypothetical protein [Planktothrix agardhii 1031]MCB8780619.1 hypothetical protein [Planktothrix agardhii 1808]MCF3568192.1 hypothetical protein [Planktothrix agardhii 1807]MCF3569264.1 hypothetical protein [Planktothrix agardhii 1805]